MTINELRKLITSAKHLLEIAGNSSVYTHITCSDWFDPEHDLRDAVKACDETLGAMRLVEEHDASWHSKSHSDT